MLVCLGVYNMISDGMLKGILLSAARPELTIYRNEKKNLGYEVRTRVFFRADNVDFLTNICDKLNEVGINYTFRDFESKVRPKPVLWVSGIINLIALSELVPDLPDAKNLWKSFNEALHIIYEGEHNTQEGLDKLLNIKGAI